MREVAQGSDASRPNSYDDVQVELTALCFYRLMPTLVSSGLTILIVCGVLAVHYQSKWFFQLTVALPVVWLFRAGVAFRFPGDRIAEMTIPTAKRWELLYGWATILYVTVSAVVTAGTAHQKDSIGVGLCTLGTFAFINGIGARVSLRPSVAKLSGLILMIGLAIALLGSKDLITRCSVLLFGLYAYIYSESVQIKYDVLVEQLRLKRKMSDLASLDVLTGLANRRAFYAQLAKACAEPEPFALLYLDLDGFKRVNDTHGHATGDMLLQQVASRLQATVPNALIARLGGDEFVLLHRLAGGLHAEEVAMGINAVITVPFLIDGKTLRVGASIGLQISEKGYADPDSLLSKADQALYLVKRAGGGSFRFAGPAEVSLATEPQTTSLAAKEEASGRSQDINYRLGQLLAGVGEQQAHLPHLGVT